MGQQTSKESEWLRLEELRDMQSHSCDMYLSLRRSGNHAASRAAWDHHNRVIEERHAIMDRWEALSKGRFLPMPVPTPPFCLPLVPETEGAAAAALSSVGSVEPGTPVGGGNVQQDQRGRSNVQQEQRSRSSSSSSSEEGAPAGNADCSEVVPLLGMEIGGAVRGLRRRHGLKGN